MGANQPQRGSNSHLSVVSADNPRGSNGDAVNKNNNDAVNKNNNNETSGGNNNEDALRQKAGKRNDRRGFRSQSVGMADIYNQSNQSYDGKDLLSVPSNNENNYRPTSDRSFRNMVAGYKSKDFKEKFLGKRSEDWKDDYIDIEGLMGVLDQVKKRLVNAERDFSETLADEVEKAEEFYINLVSELLGKGVFFPVDQDKDELATHIQQLEDFAVLNTQALKNIISTHDSISHLPFLPTYTWKLQRDDFCRPDMLDELLLRLSSTCHPNVNTETDSSISQPPTTLSAEGNISLWVPSNQVMKLTLALIKELPIISKAEFTTSTSSMYFDNSKIDLYSGSLAGSRQAPLSQNGKRESVSFEWADRTDTKEDGGGAELAQTVNVVWVQGGQVRTSSLPRSQVMSFVHGYPDATIAALLEGDPNLKAVHEAISHRHLKPALKIDAMRTQFGLGDIRVELATKINIQREFSSDQKLRDWTLPNVSVQEHYTHRFPFALLTIKGASKNDVPNFISAILSSSTYERVDDFSLNLHGMAVLFPELVKEVPGWVSGQFASLFTYKKGKNPRVPQQQDEKFTRRRGQSFFRPDNPVNTTFNRSRNTSIVKMGISPSQRRGSRISSSLGRPSDFANLNLSQMRRSSVGDRDHNSFGNDVDLYGQYASPGFNNVYRTSPSMTASMFPSIFGGTTPMGSPNGDELATDMEEKELSKKENENGEEKEKEVTRWNLLVNSCLCRGDPEDLEERKQRIRVEPKTFFANERTFMQWFNAAILLSAMGITFAGLGGGFDQLSYLVVLPLSIVVILYSFFTFLRRNDKLHKRLPSTRYSDLLGPCVLTFVLCAVFIYAIVIAAIDRSAIPLIKLNGKEIVDPVCNTGAELRIDLKPQGLVYSEEEDTLYGVGSDYIFKLKNSDKSVEYIVPRAGSESFDYPFVLTNIFGIAMPDPSSSTAYVATIDKLVGS